VIIASATPSAHFPPTNLPYGLARREPLSPASGWFCSMGLRKNVLGIEVDNAIEIAEKIDI
jgi:hypothetical protein